MTTEESAARNFIRAMRRRYAEACAKGDLASCCSLSRKVDQGERRLFALVHGPDLKPWQV